MIGLSEVLSGDTLCRSAFKFSCEANASDGFQTVWWIIGVVVRWNRRAARILSFPERFIQSEW